MLTNQREPAVSGRCIPLLAVRRLKLGNPSYVSLRHFHFDSDLIQDRGHSLTVCLREGDQFFQVRERFKQAWIADPRKDPRPHYRNLCVLKESGIGHLHLFWQVVFMKTTSKKWRWHRTKTSKNETNLKKYRKAKNTAPCMCLSFLVLTPMKLTLLSFTGFDTNDINLVFIHGFWQQWN